MTHTPSPTPNRARTYWIGWILSGLAIAFLAVDASMKLLALPIVLETSSALGFAGETTARLLGCILLISTVLYAVPRTAILGAILLTGYLGGAVATQLRVDAPLFTHILFGVYLGLFLWGGLYLRDRGVRALLPWKAAA
jgi:hypothetical protein